MNFSVNRLLIGFLSCQLNFTVSLYGTGLLDSLLLLLLLLLLLFEILEPII
jgi:hypothetical protein